MALRGKICVVHGERDGIDLATLDCRTHRHERRPDVDAMIATGAVEWLQQPTSRKEKGVVRFLKKIPHQRGLSCKIGEYGAGAVRAKAGWALTMFSDMRPKLARKTA